MRSNDVAPEREISPRFSMLSVRTSTVFRPMYQEEAEFADLSDVFRRVTAGTPLSARISNGVLSKPKR
ncbi:hypothetical protein [Natrinema caseinilyticum]|uniref:hypothetical protein n=1 Tax=Natrinema caseinilyticum TaxID=2961570 RepID=UPI0020C3DE4E|nr:hypothetical protein [Natrinema caseinilyticum]